MKLVWRTAFEQEPEISEVETECPGFVDGTLRALRPVIYASERHDNEWYRAELKKIFEAEMTEEIAGKAAKFYGSDLGQRFLAAAVTQTSATNVMSEVFQQREPQVSAEALAADKLETAKRTLQALSSDDRKAAITQISQADWFPAFQKSHAKILALNLELSNRGFTPEHDAEFDRVSEEFSQAHIESCYLAE